MNDGPFHAGEIAAQKRAGAGDVASWASSIIRDHMPQQHRDFHTSLPFVILSAADEEAGHGLLCSKAKKALSAPPTSAR